MTERKNWLYPNASGLYFLHDGFIMRATDGKQYDIEEECDLLNELATKCSCLEKENEQLEKSIEQLRTIIDDNIGFNRLFTNRELSDICNETGWELSEKSIKLQQLEKENEQLKSEISEQGTQIDFLKDENKHMKTVLNENEQLKKELDLFKPIIFESDGEPVTLYKKGDVE